MGTTDGALQKIAVGFAERPENIAFVSQNSVLNGSIIKECDDND
jgi:hypothetical protein